MKQMLMGNEAIAMGAIRANVGFASAYPGTPSTEILETLARYKVQNNDDSYYIEWSVNEKVALEAAAGAAYAGRRALVTMKMVGLNVASDPLMSLNYVGVKGGMVILVADDPGPISSQTEQDTRHYGIFAKIAVFDPSSPEEAYLMIADAFELSEKYGRPVIMRSTTRICHGRASVEVLPKLPHSPNIGFEKSPRWVIFPRLTAANKPIIEANMKKLSDEFSVYPNNSVTGGGKLGIACGGTCYAYVKEALRGVDESLYKLFKVSTFPFPEKKALEFLDGLEKVLVVEELDPVIENQLIMLKGLHGLIVEINGKRTEHTPNVGEITTDITKNAVYKFLAVGRDVPGTPVVDVPGTPALPEPPPLPVRPPVMCAGCSHRASFLAVKDACKGRKANYCGDIGCYTLGNAPPLEMVDTCLCMGGGITVAQGLERAEDGVLNFAFIGDSTLFHSGITGIINAVYNMTDIIVVILDNDTTAMTGGQQHPGMGRTITDAPAPKVSIYDVVKACGVSNIIRCNPLDFDTAKNAVTSVLDEKGVRVILFEAPCVPLLKTIDKYAVIPEKCNGCGICVKKLGCPAINLAGKKAVITYDACNGCGVCAKLCKLDAIKEVK
jgi:indolepyruvate ferredoxin oxidoreductase alpha subunit